MIEDIASGKHGGSVQTRFPPEPNGYLHIGHAKAICLDFGLAAEFGGKCNLRFDDTNPSKEETEYVEAIMEDVQWLGFQWDGLFYASDYFQQLYDWAIQLIKDGKAFVCDLSANEIREYRGTLTEPGKNSPYRDRSVEENLDLFERMKKGSSRMVRERCVQRSICALQTLVCAIQSCIESSTWSIIVRVVSGVFTRCTITRMVSRIRLSG